MIKRIVGIGAGVAAVAVAGTLGYRHLLKTGADTAAARAPESSRVITLGAEASPPAAPGKILIAPITPRQMPPKLSELKPRAPAATQPAAAPTAVQPAAPQSPAAKAPAKSVLSVAPVRPKRSQPAQVKPSTQPAPSKTAPTKKKKVISLTGEPQAGAGAAGNAASSKLTAQERSAAAAVQQLTLLRSHIATWRAQHGGRAPDFAAAPLWEQFLARDEAGRITGKPPVNPLNGQSRVIPVTIEPAAGQAVEGPFGYVYAVNSGRLFAVDGMGRVFDEAAVDAVALESKGVRELSPKDQERYVLANLDAVRGQIARYAQQHEGRVPDFARYPAFEQLSRPTTADGRLADGAAAGQTFGPYLLSMPVNAFNGRHKVATVAGEVRPGQRIERSDAGFVFSASTHRFYAIDAAGLVYDDAKARAGYVPTDAGGTGASTPKHADGSAIQPLRHSIALYRQHHHGLLPDLKRYPRWEQLAGRTRADGRPDPAGPFGPYLFNAPVNSRNNSSDVDVVRRVTKGYRPARPVGYVFETSTGTIFLTDELGKVVAE